MQYDGSERITWRSFDNWLSAALKTELEPGDPGYELGTAVKAAMEKNGSLVISEGQIKPSDAENVLADIIRNFANSAGINIKGPDINNLAHAMKIQGFM